MPSVTVPSVTVCVVIPVKDDAESLERCLRALLIQTRPPESIIVVDDGSTDGSASVAVAYGARVVPSIGTGIPAAAATGYDAADADVCARLDADCVPPTDWIERIAAAFDESPALAGLTGFARFTDGPRWLRGAAIWLYLGAYFVSVATALGHWPLFGSNLAVRRSAWDAVSGSVHRDSLVHDDMDLSFHLGPVREIRFDRTLRMGISMRPLTHPGGFGLRLRRGFRSVVVHWPAELPWLRWYRALRAANPEKSRGRRDSSRVVG